MSAFDWFIVVAYFVWIVADGLWRSKRTTEVEGYFLGGRSLPWWAVGLSVMATQMSAITLFGNTVWLTKLWYITGALLGGYPLAQGSLYLSWPRRTANKLTLASLTLVVAATIFTILSPVDMSHFEIDRPSGALLAWKWVRLMTPFINLYAVFFLIGGAIKSAWMHYKVRGHLYRAYGNALIAIGAILPGIGGSMAKAGLVEALYVGECIGIMFIWLGDRVCSVPDDVPLDRMIVYRTAGTTGHALLVPQDALAVACYLPLLNLALARYGVNTRFSSGDTACFLVGSQRHTVTYPTVMFGWGGAGFAKLNLFADDWPDINARADYFRHFAPRLLTGDPLSFADMLEAGIGGAPHALVTTAVAMSPALKSRLQAAYGCPVVDWYSLTETGPLGYVCPRGPGYHWLPHDVYIETLDEAGLPTRGRGEITVTGGRNPYIPLLRYRTGDWGRIDFAPCPCGDPMPRLMELEGRVPVRFRSGNGDRIGTQDVATVLRRYPLVQHSFEQADDGACTLTYRALAGAAWPRDDLASELRALLNQTITLREDAELGRRGAVDKVIPYVSKRIEE